MDKDLNFTPVMDADLNFAPVIHSKWTTI